MDAAVNAPVCPDCGEPVTTEEAAFCEACGRALDRDGPDPGVRSEPEAIADRDHYRLHPAAWVGGVCDRGREHRRNEDALALAAHSQPDTHAALVVCDGVTTAENSEIAALAAARAAVAVLATPLSRGVAGATSAHTAADRLFDRAIRSAQDAVLTSSPKRAGRPGACTLVAAVVSGPVIWHAAVGDSRAYLFPDDGDPVLLTRDDSMAEMLIETGMSREHAERTPVAHTITRWLGAAAPDLDPHLGSAEVLSPSWLLVCSDGLWNYASDPRDLLVWLRAAQQTAGEAPDDLAGEMVRLANAQGGHDNITVALARVGTTSTPRHDDPLR